MDEQTADGTTAIVARGPGVARADRSDGRDSYSVTALSHVGDPSTLYR
jgi:hypothetical protein